ncbi:MAG: hypothetical protein GY799_03735, partial [Desulfobulbaceae bacterium]|nr:hypothetical protein [Desulfobulbaceae bacterium]
MAVQASLMRQCVGGDPDLREPYLYDREVVRKLEPWAQEKFATRIMVNKVPLQEAKIVDALHDVSARSTFSYECQYNVVQGMEATAKRTFTTSVNGETVEYYSQDDDEDSRQRAKVQLLKLTHISPILCPPMLIIQTTEALRHFICTVILSPRPFGMEASKARRIVGLDIETCAVMQRPDDHEIYNQIRNENQYMTNLPEEDNWPGMRSWHSIKNDLGGGMRTAPAEADYPGADWTKEHRQWLGYCPRIVGAGNYPRILTLAAPMGCVAHIEFQALFKEDTLYDPERYVYETG